MRRSRTGGGQRQVRQGQSRRHYLVACEGQTEQAYFEHLRGQLGKRATIKAFADRSDPQSVVALAERKRRDYVRAAEIKGTGDRPDGVWAVMDVDVHAHLDEAVRDAPACQPG